MALVVVTLAAGLSAGIAIGSLTVTPADGAQRASGPAGFGQAVFLSHLNSPKKTPGFPGDPVFATSVPFTVAKDGYYLQYVKEGNPFRTLY